MPCDENVLLIRYRNHELTLRRNSGTFTFGRGSRCDLQLTRGAEDDREVSRQAGSIVWDDVWKISNESATRPFDIVLVMDENIDTSRPLEGDTYQICPQSLGTISEWAISPAPPHVGIKVHGRFGPYELFVTNPANPLLDDEDGESSEDTNADDPSTLTIGPAGARDTVILAAKFLSKPIPGDAIGDRVAAERASAVLPDEEKVNPKMVEDAVKRWRTRLQLRLHIDDIEGQANVNRLGRLLLALGVIRQEHRGLLEVPTAQ